MPFYDAMRVDEVPPVVTVFFFVLYFLISNLCLLNLFIAAILERLKITNEEESSGVSEAARAALIMKEQMEAQAAQKDLDNAKAFLEELKRTNGTPEELTEAAEMIAHLEEVVAKEVEESMELEGTLNFFGLSASQHALGLLQPSSSLRQLAGAIVHSEVYYWLICLSSTAAALFPCAKGKFGDFDHVDNLLTCLFGGLMWTEILLKSTADGECAANLRVPTVSALVQDSFGFSQQSSRRNYPAQLLRQKIQPLTLSVLQK